ncbi:MAG: PHP domain-containing protein, partial [Lachnospiraceae bacterium]|nr:PHP domain-containing protein [Lachnospiraceae bacterium]
MTDKELRKLSRTELLKLLIEVTEENERLTAENDNLRAGGATILVDENGRPAASNNADLGDVPSARLEEIFRSAEFAAGKFLKEAQDIADGIIADAEARAGVPEEERTVRQQETASEMTPPVRQNAPMNFNSQGYAQGYSQQAMQGYGYNAYGMGNYYQTTNAYGQQGYGMQYQPGQFYLYQPGMYQNTQGAQAQTVDYGAAGYGAGDEEVNVDFVNGETPQATSTSDLPLEGAQGPGDLGSAPTGAERRQVSAELTDEVAPTPDNPPNVPHIEVGDIGGPRPPVTEFIIKEIPGKKKFTRNARGGRVLQKPKEVNPDVIYGRYFDGEIMPVIDLTDGIGDVIVQGRVIDVRERGIKNERTIVMFDLFDSTDTITCKIFAKNEELPELKNDIKTGAFLLVKGLAMTDSFDHELTISSVRGIRKWQDFRTPRKDNAEVKRIELHCHTKMSDMDGVADVSDVIYRAHSWGMKGIAITDHAVAQAFPPAFHTWEKLKDKEDFKLIYGLDAYVVDDTKQIVENAKDNTLDSTYVVFDLETTGFSPVHNKIIEIGAVKIENGIITDRFSEFVNPKVPIPFRITNLTSITDDMVQNADTIEEVLPRFTKFCEGAVLVGHNVTFDIGFINENCRRLSLDADYTTIDTVGLSRAFFPQQGNHRLETVAKTLKVNLGFHHRAVDDADCTAQIFLKF